MATMARASVTDETKPWHRYHAKADILSGHLKQPVNQEIYRQAPVALDDLRGGHFFQRAENYSLEGLISFKSGYTRVSGSKSLKNHGWVTLATSVLEGLNVVDVLTVDRVVAQVSTEHPLENGHTPHVTFLGTRFENLCVGGYKVDVDLDLGICGEKPEGDRLYTADPGFLDRAEQQCRQIAHAAGLPSAFQADYDAELTLINQLKEHGDREQVNGFGEVGSHPKVACSLVSRIGPVPIPGAKSFGNVLEIPGFGIVTFGALEVGEKVYDPSKPSEKATNYFSVTMLKMQLGCPVTGPLQAANATANGHSHP